MSDWIFQKPKVCTKPLRTLFADTPFTGIRLNKMKLIRNITTDDLQHSQRLMAVTTPIPSMFSWRYLKQTDNNGVTTNVTPNVQITKPLDQGGCGSCWAFAITMALADRYLIANAKKNKKIKLPVLSPLWLMNQTVALMDAGSSANTCNNGGDPYMGCKWLEQKNNGLKLETCWPYSIIKNRNPKWVNPLPLPKDCCVTCCGTKATDSKILFNVQPGSTRSLVSNTNLATIATIQREIMTNGPVICGFIVFNDFLGIGGSRNYWRDIAPYTNAPHEGVYICSNSSNSNFNGGHAVTVTGWGTCKNLKNREGKLIRYWEVRNTWGTIQADAGYGRVAFSTDVSANAALEFDVPRQLFGNDQFSGGMMTMMPASLPENYKTKNDQVENYSYNEVKCKKNTNYFSLLLFIIAIVLLIIVVIKLFEN